MSNIFPINGIVNFNKRPVIYCFFHFDFSTPLGYNTASLTGLRTICKTRYRKENLEVTTMKKLYAVLLAMVMVLSLAACSQNAANNAGSGDEGESQNVEMQYMSLQEQSDVLGTDGYTVLDVRKAADYETSHIPGAVSADMDAAVNGDTAAGEETMTAATEGLDDTLVLVCYSGKKYAQASTNALSAIGYDMDKVVTLEGGFTAWTETYPDNVE